MGAVPPKENMGQQIRVLIADDSLPAREGMRALLDTWPGIAVVGEVANGQEAIERVEEVRPAVVLMDARMPRLDGVRATRLIKSRWPEIRVVLLTMYASSRREALAAGADTFLVKGCPAQDVLDAITG